MKPKIKKPKKSSKGVFPKVPLEGVSIYNRMSETFYLLENDMLEVISATTEEKSLAVLKKALYCLYAWRDLFILRTEGEIRIESEKLPGKVNIGIGALKALSKRDEGESLVK